MKDDIKAMAENKRGSLAVSEELQIDNVMGVLRASLEGIYKSDTATYLMTVHQITRVINQAVREIESGRSAIDVFRDKPN